MASIVHCGWMTKSPPERKLRKHLRIFRSWKKRYFVLRKPSSSLPDQYELHYYKDQRCQQKKGSVDLDQCQQIIEALDSDVFPYLLAIKTSYKHKLRTYYLATDSEQDMNTWVQCLCYACGLRPEDQPTDIPEAKPGLAVPEGHGAQDAATNGASPSPSRHAGTAKGSPSTTLQRTKDSQSARAQPLAATGSGSNSLYKQLENSSLRPHKTPGKQTSIESTADEAPPLPQKQRQGGHSNGLPAHEDVFVVSMYDHPPSQRSVDTSNVGLYESPPSQRLGATSSAGLYESLPTSALRASKNVEVPGRALLPDVPSSHGHNSHASLSAPSDSWTPDGIPGRPPIEVRDFPTGSSTSSGSELPPERPPKPHFTSPYQNLPSSTGRSPAVADLMCSIPAPTRSTQLLTMAGYDVPRLPGQRPAQPREPTTPPGSTNSCHTYLNTSSPPGSAELPLDSLSRRGSRLAATAQPGMPPPRAGFVAETFNERSVSVYQSPPSSSGSSLSSGSPSHPRSPASLANGGSQVQDKNNSSIFSTKRTRSFKNPHSLKPQVVQDSHRNKALSLSVTVPAPRPVLPPRPLDMTCADGEEIRSYSQEEETHHSLSLLHSVPAPTSETDRELKYIDLALPESGLEPARSPQPLGHHTHSHAHGHTHSHAHGHTDRGKEVATEYREIDFVKTQALNDTKRCLTENKRQNEDQN